MTLVTGTVEDLGYDAMTGTLWARPARFRSDGGVVLAPERKPFPIEGGVVSAELAPGPAVLEIRVGTHARGTFEVVIPDQVSISLADLLDTVFAWEPEQVSQFVAEREAAQQAKADAELAAQQAGQDRAHVDSIREHLDEAAQSNVAPYLTQTELNATYAPVGDYALKTELTDAEAFTVETVTGDLYATSSTTGKRTRLSTGLTLTDGPHSRPAGVVFSTAEGQRWVPYSGIGGPRPLPTDFAKFAGWGSSTMFGLMNHMATYTTVAGRAPAGGVAWYNGGVSGELATETLARLTTTPAQRQAVTLLNIGKNDLLPLWEGEAMVQPILDKTRQAYDYLGSYSRHILVLGHFNNRDDEVGNTLRRRKIALCNKELARQYQGRFIDQHSWMVSPQLWVDTGLTPTQADLDAQAAGNKPPSVSADHLHLNTAGNSGLRKLIDRHLSNLGWYSHVPITFRDDFNRANSSAIGSMPQGGFAWKAPKYLANTSIVDNAFASAAPQIDTVYVDTAMPVTKVTAKLAAIGTTPGTMGGGLALVNTATKKVMWLSTRIGTAVPGLSLWATALPGTAWSAVGNSSPTVAVSGDVLSLTLSASGEVVGFLNGVEVCRHTDTDMAGATGAGFQIHQQGTATRWDYIEINPA